VRLIELTITAIGPFADTVSVDFERLGRGGLFLLEGPTGSGKSTIIDAITFALYGTTAGNSSLERLHSRAAPAGTVPVVDLVFEVPEGRFRISRSPTHERPKLRGDGITSSPASARLWLESDADVDRELKTARAREVDAEVLRLVGLTRDQFVQTVVLPQGEFSRFLCAKPNERAEVLKRLFVTETYDAITNELHGRRLAAIREREDAAHRVTTLAAVFTTAARLRAVDVTSISATDSSQLLGLATEAIGELSTHVESSERELATVARIREERERELDEAQRLDRARRRYTEATTALSRLEAERDEYDGWVRRMNLLSKVDSIIPFHHRLATARTEADQAREAWRQAAEPADLPLATTGDELTALLGTTLTLRATLTQFAALERGLAATVDEIETDRVRSVDLDRQVLERRAALASSRRRLDDLTERRHTLEARASDPERLRAELDRKQEHHDAAVELERLRIARDGLRADLTTAHQVAADAERHAAQLRSAYLDEIAGRLALELVDGDACPVCGSEDHPRPAPAPRSSVSRDELDAAEAAWSKAVTALRQTDGQVRHLDEKVAGAAAACGNATVEAARTELAAIRENLERATREASELGLVREELVELTSLIDDAQRTLSTGESELVALRERLRVGEEQLARTRAALDPHRGPNATVAEHLADIESHCRALESANRVLVAREKSEAALTGAEADYGTALDRAELESEDVVADLIDELNQLPDLRHRIGSHDARVAAACAILSDPEVARVADLDPPDVVGAGHRAQSARELHDRALALDQRFRDRLEAARVGAADIRQAVATLRKVEHRTSDVIRLAEVLSGGSPDNLLDLPLATYVLIDRFRAVVEAANERLQVMSDGRYLLEHHGDREDRARLAGLGLRVRDLQTDSIRDPRTLSGGETFYASLSLALGLADVVTAEAGGRSLGTLFIDEGFGGLDSDTLDQVMEEIEQLRTSDRVVGLVSHVRELKDRIPNRVEIRRLGQGRSEVRVVAPA